MIRRTHSDWGKLAEEYYSSGESQDQFCKKHTLNLYTFRDRLSKMRKVAILSDTQESETVELEVAKWMEVIPKAVSPATTAEELRIGIGKFAITVPHDFDEASFIRVCKALMSLC